jgi:tetratricopeptide (TPR) repeat protein
MVRDLAQAYIAQRDYQAAIDVIQRLVRERDTDVSAYNLALTFETMASAYWLMNQPEDAKAALQEGLRRFPSGWQAEQLRKTLARYEAAAVR